MRIQKCLLPSQVLIQIEQPNQPHVLKRTNASLKNVWRVSLVVSECSTLIPMQSSRHITNALPIPAHIYMANRHSLISSLLCSIPPKYFKYNSRLFRILVHDFKKFHHLQRISPKQRILRKLHLLLNYQQLRTKNLRRCVGILDI